MMSSSRRELANQRLALPSASPGAMRTSLPCLAPMVCSPEDMFYGSDLRNLAIGDFLVRKP
jgi:hypothetical protein